MASRTPWVIDGPPKSLTLGAGMIAVIPQGAWHRSHSAGNTHPGLTPFPGEHDERDVDDPRRERKPEGETESKRPTSSTSTPRSRTDHSKAGPRDRRWPIDGERRSIGVLP